MESGLEHKAANYKTLHARCMNLCAINMVQATIKIVSNEQSSSCLSKKNKRQVHDLGFRLKKNPLHLQALTIIWFTQKKQRVRQWGA